MTRDMEQVPYSCLVQQHNIHILQYLLAIEEIRESRSHKALIHNLASCRDEEYFRQTVHDLKLDINEQDSRGFIAAHFAALNGNYLVLKVLLDEPGANVAAKSADGFTLLHCASEGGNLSIVKDLVEKHFPQNLDCPLEDGTTPLALAVKECNSDVVEYLIKNGADVNAVTANQVSVLHLACANGYTHPWIRVVSAFSHLRCVIY